MASSSRGLVALVKRGWNEIPEILASSFMGAIGLAMTGVGLVKYYARDGDNRKFKEQYTVYRHDDPRAARVRSGIDA